jgi:nitrogen fixation/metabolism regulation signal transduction histidine kinase
MKLEKRLILYFSFVALIPLFLLASLFYVGSYYYLNNEIRDQLIGVADREKDRISAYVQRQQEILAIFSENQELRESVNTYVNAKNMQVLSGLNTLIGQEIANRGADEIFILDPKGKVIVASDTSLVGKDFSHENFFASGKETESLVGFTTNKDKVVQSIIAGPIYLESKLFGKLLGVVVFKTAASDLFAVTGDNSELKNTGEVYIVINQDNVLYYLTPLRFNSHAVLQKISDKSPDTVSLVAEEKSGQIANGVDYRGNKVIAITNILRGFPGRLIVKMDENEIQTPIIAISFLLIPVIVTTFIVTFIIAVYLATIIFKPIGVLTQSVLKIKDGDLSQRISVNSKDEIGILANAFNEMIIQLQNLYKNLEQKVQEKTGQLTEKVEELQKINNIMVDREMKIIELKNKVASYESHNDMSVESSKPEEKKENPQA